MKTPKKEVLIGLYAVLALVVLFFGIEFLKGVNVFKPANYYYASYTNVAGIQQSAPVTLNGFKVGQVREITYEYDNPGHVRIEMSLDRALRLPVGTKAVIEQDLLGTSSVVLQMSDSKDFHIIGDKLVGETAKGLMGTVSEQLMPSVSAIFPKIDSLVTALNVLVRDPALAQSVKRLDDITLSLSQTMKKLDATAGQLSPVMTNVKDITGNVNELTANLSQVSDKLAAMPVDSLMNNIMAVSSNLRTLSEELNNPNSTLGALTHDRALYNNLNAAAASLDSLLIDVKKNPKRYISIKLL